jgi:hypothetical protein
VTDEDGIVVVTIGKPPANALDVELLEEIVDTLAELTSQLPKAVVLTGRPGVFSAGLDLKAFPAYGPTERRRSASASSRRSAPETDVRTKQEMRGQTVDRLWAAAADDPLLNRTWWRCHPCSREFPEIPLAINRFISYLGRPSKETLTWHRSTTPTSR